MPDVLHKSAATEINELLPGERAAVFIITTHSVDRDGEVIVPKGLDLAAYNRNRVVLAMHDQASWPIGRAQWIKATNGGRQLRSKVQFAETEAGEEIWQLVKADIARGASIGMIPDVSKAGPPTQAERRERPDWAQAKRIYRKGELVEWSIVPVPANPDAVAVAVAKGLMLPKWMEQPSSADLKRWTPEPPTLPKLTGRTFAQAHAELIKRLKSVAAQKAALTAQDRLELLQGKV